MSGIFSVFGAGDLPTHTLRQPRKLVLRSGERCLPTGLVLDLVEHQLRDPILLRVWQTRRLGQGHVERLRHQDRVPGRAKKRQNPRSQPFGGEGLSGTGPKAGGPRYLYRFATERSLSINTAAQGGNAALMALEEE